MALGSVVNVPAEAPGPHLGLLTGPRALVLGVSVGTLPLTGVTRPAGPGVPGL